MIHPNYSLYYYLEPGRTPFLSITSLSNDKAKDIAAELAPGTTSPKNRFCAEDFPGYYEKRLATEKWLYRSFIEKGGDPITEHPIYFTLGESNFLHKWFGNGTVYSISLKDVQTNRVSFTLGDSMALYGTRSTKVLTSKELSDLLDRYSIDEIKRDCDIQYIEAQLWYDDFTEYILSVFECNEVASKATCSVINAKAL